MKVSVCALCYLQHAMAAVSIAVRGAACTALCMCIGGGHVSSYASSMS